LILESNVKREEEGTRLGEVTGHLLTELNAATLRSLSYKTITKA
jgi:hypothetical protein